MRTLTARGIAVIYISHKMDELYRICRRVTVLRDGRLCTPPPSPHSLACNWSR